MRSVEVQGKISIAESVPHDVYRLCATYLARETVYRRDQSPQDVAWWGKLAL